MLLKIVGAICAMLVVGALVVAIGMWRGLIPVPGVLVKLLAGGGEPEYSARYYPPDMLSYSWVTLVPAEGQFDDLRGIWDRLNESRAFRDVVELAQDEFEAETGIDFKRDVMSWVGPELSVGLLDADWGRGELVVAAMMGVRDKDAAERFLDDWLDYMEEEWNTEFDRDAYRGFDILVSEDGYQAYALTDGWLIFANDKRALEDILVRVDGHEDTSLATEESFQEARSQLQQRRLASFYVSPREAEDLLGDLADEWLGGSGVVVPDDEPLDWVAGSVGLEELSIVMEVAGPLGTEQPLEFPDLSDPSNLVAGDALGFAAMTFDPDIDHWRRALEVYEIGDYLSPEDIDGLSAVVEEFSPGIGLVNAVLLDADDGLDAVLDLGLDVVDLMTGIDLEDDLFDHLAGEMIVAVGGVDLSAADLNAPGNAVDAVVMLSYSGRNRDDLADTMDDIAELLAVHAGLDTDTEDVGADDEAVVFDLEALAGERTGYRPGYVLHDGYLTLGSTEDALEGVVERQNGDAKGLSSDDEYLRAVGLLPDQRQFLAYVDVHSIVRQLEAEDIGLSRAQHRALENSIGVVVMSSYIPRCLNDLDGHQCEVQPGAEAARHTVVITLFPE